MSKNAYVWDGSQWVSVIGIQGPPGVANVVRSALWTGSTTTNVIGTAPTGTAEGSTGWALTKIVVASAGTVTITRATGTWTGRESATYT